MTHATALFIAGISSVILQ